jgi:NADH-quinone oxidoreductase subunit J
LDFLVESGPALLFYLFAGLALVSAVFVVTMRNPMYGAIALLVSFLSIAVLFLLRHAEFLAIVQMFVYGGGIMVLFLFVIMLVNLPELKRSKRFVPGASLAVIVVIGLAVLFISTFLALAVWPVPGDAPELMTVDGELVGNTEAVAWSLFREYLLPFEIVSLFLLVAMIGAVVLGRRE